ncbi:MAG: biotin/lipoate A/B protein ligase family protein [Magnetospirillum sp.]
MIASWHFIESTDTYPDFSLATLPALEDQVRGGQPPKLALNVFGRDGITIGFNEDPNQILNVPLCRDLGIDFRRRVNGGGTIYAAAGSCVIALAVPADLPGLPKTAAEAFETVLPVMARVTEQRFGIPARWRPMNDIEVEGRKLMPTSVKIEGGVLTFRIMINVKAIDTDIAGKLMPMPPEKVRDKVHKDIASRFTCLEAELGRPVAQDELAGLARDLAAALFPDVTLSPAVAPAAVYPAEMAGSDWDFARSEATLFGPHRTEGDHIGRGREKAPGGMIWAALLTKDGHILRAIVNGDYPARPVNAPDRLEAMLQGVAADEASVRSVVEAFQADASHELAGVSTEALMSAFSKALG